MQIYRHRQRGTLMLWALGAGAVLSAWPLFLPGPPGMWIVAGVVLAVLVVAMVLFYALTVEVTPLEVAVWFGPGVIRRRFPVAEIRGARAVRNPWYYGWGVRLTPHGWLFNVSGFDAVELDLRNGRRFRIGTGDPQGLLAAIERAAGLSG